MNKWTNDQMNKLNGWTSASMLDTVRCMDGGHMQICDGAMMQDHAIQINTILCYIYPAIEHGQDVSDDSVYIPEIAWHGDDSSSDCCLLRWSDFHCNKILIWAFVDEQRSKYGSWTLKQLTKPSRPIEDTAKQTPIVHIPKPSWRITDKGPRSHFPQTHHFVRISYEFN